MESLIYVLILAAIFITIGIKGTPNLDKEELKQFPRKIVSNLKSRFSNLICRTSAFYIEIEKKHPVYTILIATTGLYIIGFGLFPLLKGQLIDLRFNDDCWLGSPWMRTYQYENFAALFSIAFPLCTSFNLWYQLIKRQKLALRKHIFLAFLFALLNLTYFIKLLTIDENKEPTQEEKTRFNFNW